MENVRYLSEVEFECMLKILAQVAELQRILDDNWAPKGGVLVNTPTDVTHFPAALFSTLVEDFPVIEALVPENVGLVDGAK